MIYSGYPCVGKSSICGTDNNIDLESSNFFYTADGTMKRDESWEKVYVNIAEDLSSQGYNVFLSSHGAVTAELNKRGVKFVGIMPSPNLKEEWIKRAEFRYKENPSSKNKKALDRIIDHFEEDINSFKESCGDNKIIRLFNANYDLSDVIRTLNRSTDELKFAHCASCYCSTTGYCPIGTSIGCVSRKDGGIISNIEEFDSKS